MTEYTTRATRRAKGWELHVLGVGVRQSRILATAPAEARDYSVLQTGVSEANVQVRIETDLGEVGERIAVMRLMQRHAEAEQIEAGRESRRIAHGQGPSGSVEQGHSGTGKAMAMAKTHGHSDLPAGPAIGPQGTANITVGHAVVDRLVAEAEAGIPAEELRRRSRPADSVTSHRLPDGQPR